MSDEYKTLRVMPDVYKRVHEVQEKLSAIAESVMPTSAHNISYDYKRKMVSVGSVIAIALESLDREMDSRSAAKASEKKASK